MQIFTEELQDGITLVILEGRMDIEGANSINLKLNIIGGTKTAVLVDMQKVSYLASIGIGVLMTVAKTIKNKGGKFAFFAPSAVVDQVLRNTGIYQVFPVHYELEPAIAALK
jgi:anti-sigma B factor antagonist